MSDQSGDPRTCPTCGATVPPSARYCPSCGTRLDPQTPYSSDEFEDALADVLDAPEETLEPPPPAEPATVSEPSQAEAPMTPLPTAQPEWTTRASDWAEPSGTWTSPPTPAAPPRKQNRTLWIILAIAGFLVFCCCSFFFFAVAVA